MVKRAISGKGRRGAPPLPRQRRALRIVQLSLLALAAFVGNLAYRSWLQADAGEPGASLVEVAALGLATAAALAGVWWMGVRTVRGPQPPVLE